MMKITSPLALLLVISCVACQKKISNSPQLQTPAFSGLLGVNFPEEGRVVSIRNQEIMYKEQLASASEVYGKQCIDLERFIYDNKDAPWTNLKSLIGKFETSERMLNEHPEVQVKPRQIFPWSTAEYIFKDAKSAPFAGYELYTVDYSPMYLDICMFG